MLTACAFGQQQWFDLNLLYSQDDTDATINDRSTNSRNGTLNTPSSATWTAQGILLDGAHIQTRAANGNYILGDSTWALELWVRADSIPSAMGSNTMIHGDRSIFIESRGADVVRFDTHSGGGWLGAKDSPSNTLIAGQWYYIVTSSDTDSVRHYVNGSYIGGQDNTGKALTRASAATGRIGSNYLGTTSFFKGVISQYRLRYRTLSAGEILSTYNLKEYKETYLTNDNYPKTIKYSRFKR